MSTRPTRGARAVLVMSSLVLAAASASTVSAGTEETISVNVDQAKLIRLPQNISTLVVGNPLIADVTMQPGGMVVVTGKGYGATNVIAMDRKGSVIADRLIQVEGPMDKVVTVYRGVERESYSCMPVCQRRITLGDSETYFKSTIDQAGTLNNQATGASAPKN
ncbi:pilus assembly protein N-terminal domain-containing protein [Rhodopseudomonas sp.]|uniref:pilus assembly protein N-terminal domain-containing protein n=1 Tax=Rhodopseudomonas sp. TaxID=1078 RepID=UPI003B3A8C24